MKVDLANDQGKAVVKFFGDLVNNGLATSDADFNDSWYQGLANGKGDPADRRVGSGVPPGHRRQDLGAARERCRSGKAGENVSSNWGGSTDAVLKLSKNQIAASQLALWINTDKESMLRFANEQFLFPPLTSVLSDPAFTDQEAEFYGGQKVNETFAQISETVSTDFGWLPFMDFVYSNFNETLGKALPTRPTPSPVSRPGRTAASSTPKTRASRSPDPWRAAGTPGRAPPLPKGHPCPPPCPAPGPRHPAARAPRSPASG